jgi:MSHA pilin protein MshD
MRSVILRQKGLTLIELVMTIVIISIAMAATLGVFSNSMQHSADPMWQFKSIKIAQLYLDEIISKKFDKTTPLGGEPASKTVNCGALGPEPGESRATYDDVDDYINLNNVTPTKVTGALDPSYQQYKVRINVVCAGSDVGLPNDRLKRITITITPPGQQAMDFTVYKGNY